MHKSGMDLMRDFVERFGLRTVRVLDMGSMDINGNYRGLFPGGEYVGADIRPGKNVDVIVGTPEWSGLLPFDAVISGQTLEHVADIPKFMADCFCKLKFGGFLCVIAPSAGPRHDAPIWVGHFSKDEMAELVAAAGFDVIEAVTIKAHPFDDTRVIARKAEVTHEAD